MARLKTHRPKADVDAQYKADKEAVVLHLLVLLVTQLSDMH